MTGVAQIRYLEASGPVKIPAELSSVLPGRIEAVPCRADGWLARQAGCGRISTIKSVASQCPSSTV